MDDLISRYEAKLKDYPENELIHFSLGKAYFDAGRYSDAETHLKFALDKKRDWMVVTMLLAQCALRRGDKEFCRELYEQALALAINQNHEGPEQEIRDALAGL